MGAINRLLLSAGGGIEDYSRKCPRGDEANLIIGLGGTGADAVMKLKKEVYKQLQPDDLDAVVPAYETIKCLIIDSDDTKIRKQHRDISDIDPNTEYFSIAHNAIRAALTAAEAQKESKGLDWMNVENISVDDARHGAGCIRQVGRFLLVDKAPELYAAIKSAMMSALKNAKGNELRVHICCGLSGGTGSGIFLDVCYLVRQALCELAIGRASVYGYFFLPDVNLSVPSITHSPCIQDFIKENGYAALKELDYCMNFRSNNGRFEMDYGFLQITRNDPPVDACFLISAQDSNGFANRDGYAYAINVCSEFILNLMKKMIPQPGDLPGQSVGSVLEPLFANLLTIKAAIRTRHGAGQNYNLLGAFSAEVSQSDIMNYLGARLFETCEQMLDRVPTRVDCEEFQRKARLGYEEIRARLMGKCSPAVKFGDSLNAKMYRENGNHRFVEAAAAFLEENRAELEKNKHCLMADLKGYSWKNSTPSEHMASENEESKPLSSLICETYRRLFEDYICNLEYGPIFSRNMIYGGANHNLIYVVDGLICQNEQMLVQERFQDSLREAEYEEASRRMDRANIFNRNKRCDEYKWALSSLYAHHCKIEICTMLGEILQNFKKQLIDLDCNLLCPLRQVLDDLKDTYAENLGTVMTHQPGAVHCVRKDLSVQDMRDELDRHVQEIDLRQMLHRWMIRFFEDTEKWTDRDENKISHLISELVYEEFRDVSQIPLTEYLQRKYQEQEKNRDNLTSSIQSEILENTLAARAVPVSWMSPFFGDRFPKMEILAVPFDQKEIIDAARTYKNKYAEVDLCYVDSRDRLSMLKLYAGLPLYAFAEMSELAKIYEKRSHPGRHIFEGKDVNWNNDLPSPIPASFRMSFFESECDEKTQALKAEFAQALERGVITTNTQDWYICVAPDWNISEIVPEFSGMNMEELDQLDDDVLEAALERIRELYRDIAAKARQVRIDYPTAVFGLEEQVMMDSYLASPEMNRLVKAELEKRNALEKWIADIETAKMRRAGTEK